MSQLIIDLDKNKLSQILANKTDLNNDQIKHLFPVIVEKVFAGLRKEVNQDNTFSLFNLLNNDHISYSNPIISNIGSGLITYLVNHFKVSDSTARSVSTIALPYLIKEISGKLNLTGDANGDLANLMGIIGEDDLANHVNTDVENSSKEIGGLSYLLSRR